MCSVVRLTGSYRPCLSRFLISSSRHIPFPRRLLTPFIGSLPSPLHLVRYASRTEWNGVWRDVEWKEGEEVGYGWKQSEMWSGVTDVDRLPSLCIPLLTTSLPFPSHARFSTFTSREWRKRKWGGGKWTDYRHYYFLITLYYHYIIYPIIYSLYRDYIISSLYHYYPY